MMEKTLILKHISRMLCLLISYSKFTRTKTTIEYDGVDITIYNEERLLIELIRNKRKFSFDLYKEIISNYRKLIHKMDMTQIMEYAYELPKTNMVMETIRLEIL